MKALVTGLILILSLGGQTPKAASQTAGPAEQHIRRLIDGLPRDCHLRGTLQAGQDGDGIQRPWTVVVGWSVQASQPTVSPLSKVAQSFASQKLCGFCYNREHVSLAPPGMVLLRDWNRRDGILRTATRRREGSGRAIEPVQDLAVLQVTPMMIVKRDWS